jgi:hypothetical protein
MDAGDREVIRETVRETLISLGVDHTNPIEVQKDFAALRELRKLTEDPDYIRDQLHLRRWRKAVDTVENKGILAALWFVIIGGIATAVVGFAFKFGLFK